MSPPRRALISITSATAPLHGGHPTGMFICEALHPFNVFKANGIEVDIVSEKGTYTADWLSMQPTFYPDEDRNQFEDKQGEFRSKLDAGLTPDKVDASKYGIFFASAGHAALLDYPTAAGLQSLASKIYANGGVMSSVCHGPALYPGIVDAWGQPIVKGKTITGFTTEGEEVMHIMGILRGWEGVKMVDEWAEVLGAKYVRPDGVWDSFHVTDGRIVSGTNPASSVETAQAVVDAFAKL